MIKLIRSEPEIPGGKTTAEVPESALAEALSNGWKVAEKEPDKPQKTAEPVKQNKPAGKPKLTETQEQKSDEEPQKTAEPTGAPKQGTKDSKK